MLAIRIVGMIITLAASSALGMYLASRAVFRKHDLLEIRKALSILKSEIEFAASPLPEAMANIAARTTGPISDIAGHFAARLKNNDGETAYDLWLYSIESHKKSSFLTEEDTEVLGGFGKTLGYLDKQMQADSIKFTMDYIDTQVTEIQEGSQKNQRMYKSLGVIGGILLLVVFW